MKSILIIKTSAIGDIIHTFPVLEYLRARFPEACLDWVVEKGSADLLKRHPFIHKVILVDTKSWRKNLLKPFMWGQFKAFKKELQETHYDVLFDLQGNCKSALITLLASAKDKVGYSFATVREKPNAFVTNKRFTAQKGVGVREGYLQVVKQYFKESYVNFPKRAKLRLNEEEKGRLDSILNKKALQFMVAFGSKWENKRLSEAVLREFLAKIHQAFSPSFIFIWADAEEKAMAERLEKHFANSFTLGNLSLPLWQAVMDEVAQVIAMDSAALALCGTTNTPSFSVFGPSSAPVYKPSEDKHVTFQGTCPYGKVFEERCPILRTCKTGACIKNITPDALFKAFLKSYNL